MKSNLGYRDLFGERNYMRNFFAGVITRFGDSIDALAFAWMVYEVTGDRSWSALMVGLNMLPSILFMPFAGVLVERFDKRKVMVAADIGRATLVSVVAALYMMGMVTPVILALSTLLMSTFEAFRIPAGLALYPKIVPREKYTLATSFSKSVGSIAEMVGAGAFGVILAALGLEAAMLINAGTFVISALLVASIRVKETLNRSEKLNFRNYSVELKEGYKYLYSKRIVFMVCIIGSVISLLLTPFSSLLTPYIQESLHLGAEALSTVSIAVMGGSLVGTALFPMLSRRVSKSKLFLIGGIFTGIAYFLSVAISGVQALPLVMLSLVIMAVVYGLGGAFIQVVVSVSFMEQVEPQYLGRVGSIFNSFSAMLVPFGSFAVAGVAKVLTVNQVFLVFGALTLLLYGTISMSKLFRTIDLPQGAEKGEIGEIQDT